MVEQPPAPSIKRSHLYQLVEEKLHAPVDQFIAERRQAGTPYHKIAHEIIDKTGVEVTHEAIRRWYRADQATDTD